MSFHLYTLILAVVLLAVVFVMEVAVPKGMLSASRVARSRLGGGIIGIICIAWSTRYILLMLEGGASRYHNLAILLMALLAVLCLVYLDYLFTRALGGFILLTVNVALHEAFVIDLPARGIYALLAYILALAAMILIGLPWRFRHLLEAAQSSPRWRHAAGGLMVVAAAVLVGFTVVA